MNTLRTLIERTSPLAPPPVLSHSEIINIAEAIMLLSAQDRETLLGELTERGFLPEAEDDDRLDDIDSSLSELVSSLGTVQDLLQAIRKERSRAA